MGIRNHMIAATILSIMLYCVLDHFKHMGEVQRVVAITLLFRFVSSTKECRGETKIHLSTGIISYIGYAGNISTGTVEEKLRTFISAENMGQLS